MLVFNFIKSLHLLHILGKRLKNSIYFTTTKKNKIIFKLFYPQKGNIKILCPQLVM